MTGLDDWIHKNCTPCRTESSCSHPSARSNSSVLLWYPLDVKSWERKKTIRKLKTSNWNNTVNHKIAKNTTQSWLTFCLVLLYETVWRMSYERTGWKFCSSCCWTISKKSTQICAMCSFVCPGKNQTNQFYIQNLQQGQQKLCCCLFCIQMTEHGQFATVKSIMSVHATHTIGWAWLCNSVRITDRLREKKFVSCTTNLSNRASMICDHMYYLLLHFLLQTQPPRPQGPKKSTPHGYLKKQSLWP